MDGELLKALHESGYMGIEIPAAYGGSEMSFLASCLAVEEFAKVGLRCWIAVGSRRCILRPRCCLGPTLRNSAPPLRPGGRQRQRLRGRSKHARQQRFQDVGERRREGALLAAAGAGHHRLLLPVGSRLGV
jgi:hypothetical protein